jgi:hypothetical protein
MHNEYEGNGTECSVGQDKTFIPQPAHHLLATQHEHQDACTVLSQPKAMFKPLKLQGSYRKRHYNGFKSQHSC